MIEAGRGESLRAPPSSLLSPLRDFIERAERHLIYLPTNRIHPRSRSRKDPSLSLFRRNFRNVFASRYSREMDGRMDGWMDGWMDGRIDRSARTDVVVHHRSRLLIFASRESKQIEIPGAPFNDMNIRAISAFCAVI